MNRPSILHRLNTLIRAEWQHLTAITPSDRRWQMPFAGALASALPLVVGAFFGHLGYGLISSVGGLVFLYLPHTFPHVPMFASPAFKGKSRAG